ncbi:hypothetical protein [Rhodococcus ruber]|nr:hypothetical protein [Rhodococcus ruber]
MVRWRFARWKLTRPYPSGALTAPIQYQHLGDLTTVGQNEVMLSAEGPR